MFALGFRVPIGQQSTVLLILLLLGVLVRSHPQNRAQGLHNLLHVRSAFWFSATALCVFFGAALVPGDALTQHSLLLAPHFVVLLQVLDFALVVVYLYALLVQGSLQLYLLVEEFVLLCGFGLEQVLQPIDLHNHGVLFLEVLLL